MAGVLSRGVEQSSIEARPLVHVYSPRAVRNILTDAGLRNVVTCVRHLRSGDTYPTMLLSSFPRALDRLGHRVGWYVVGSATTR